MRKSKVYPMTSGPFLGLVVDYERLVFLGSSNYGPVIEDRKARPKVKTKIDTRNVRLNSNRRGDRRD